MVFNLIVTYIIYYSFYIVIQVQYGIVINCQKITQIFEHVRIYELLCIVKYYLKII